MKAQALTINAETGVATFTGALRALLGTLFQLQTTFVDDAGDATELEAGTTGRLVLKAPGALGGDLVLLDAAWSHTTGETKYLMATLADSEQLRDLIDEADGDDGEFRLVGQVEWKLPSEDDPRKSYPFTVQVINSPARSDDDAPNVAGERASVWLDPRAPRMDKSLALTAGQRTQLLTNIGNVMQSVLSDDAAYVHLYTAAGAYVGSYRLTDLGQDDL